MVRLGIRSKLIIVLLGLFSHIETYAQLAPATLKQALLKTPADSVLKQGELLWQLASWYSDSRPDSSQYFSNEVFKLVNRTTDPKLKLQLYLLLVRNDVTTGGTGYINLYAGKAICLAKEQDNAGALARLNYCMGYYYQYMKQNPDSAAAYFVQTLRFASKATDTSMIGHANTAFGKLYLSGQHFDSAYHYFNKAVECFKILTDGKSLALAYLNLGAAQASLKQFKEAHLSLKKAYDLSIKTGDKKMETMVLFNIANTYHRNNEKAATRKTAGSLYQKAKAYGQQDMIIYATTLLATLKLEDGDSNAALAQALDALRMSKAERIAEFISANYETIIGACKSKNDFERALMYLEEKKHFDDSLTRVQSTNYLEKLKGEYNLEIKNKELFEKTELLQQKEKDSRNKSIIIALLCVMLVGFLLFFYLLWERRKTGLRLQRQRADYRKQLQNFQSFINGQETERRRIASDLHDGLAQNLVMLRMHVAGLSADTEKDKTKKSALQEEINQLINETRKIAHNMMPDVLTELGLQRALKSLVSRLSDVTTGLEISLEIAEPFAPIDKNTEIQLYRIVQELLNNVVKHAGATQCEVHLASTPQQVTVRVNDNGKGVKKNNKSSGGMGLKSVASRVHSLGGEFSSDTNREQGCQFTVNIPVQPNDDDT